MKLCSDCRHFHHNAAGFAPYCSGPHIAVSIIDGRRSMSLPAARYWDPVQPLQSAGFDCSSAQPCGESGRNFSAWPSAPPDRYPTIAALLKNGLIAAIMVGGLWMCSYLANRP